MPLHIEQVVDDLKTFLQANLKSQLDTVLAEHSNTLPMRVPRFDDYFIGEPNRYRAYTAPAIFLATPATIRPGEGGADEWATMLRQEHRVLIDVLMEAAGEDQLTRMCWRMAQAIDSCLHDQDVTPAGITTRSCKVLIPKIDYGQMFVSKDQRTFRKDIWVELLVRHWDLLTPLPIQSVVGGTQVVSIGTIGSTSAVAASVSELFLTTTNSTAVLVFTPGTNGGNYAVDIYYRIVGAPTTLTITVAYDDGSGHQTSIPVANSQAVGSVSVDRLFFNSVGGMPITINATAGTANQVYISATIESQS